jgi:hypothetical protein
MPIKSKLKINNELFKQNKKISVKDIIAEEKKEVLLINPKNFLDECMRGTKYIKSRKNSKQEVGKVSGVIRRRNIRCLP